VWPAQGWEGHGARPRRKRRQFSLSLGETISEPRDSSQLAHRLPTTGAIVAGLAIAGLSLLVEHSTESDLWAWLIWGREVTHLALDTSYGPTWKPLTVLLAVPLSVSATAAPTLTLLVIRAAWLLAFILAYRIGNRLAGRTAGLIGAAGLLLVPDASAEGVRYFVEGRAEPLIAALVLAAVDRHLAGRRVLALVLGCLAALGRPEAWPLAVAYGVVVWRSTPQRRWPVPALLGAVPLLWVGGGLWGAGDALDAVRSVQSRVPGDGQSPTLAGWLLRLETAARLIIPPYLLAAAVALAHAARVRLSGEDETARVILALGIGATAWIAADALGALLGFPMLARFLLPPVAIISILAGVGFIRVLEAIADTRARAATAVILCGITLLVAAPRLGAAWEQASPNEGSRAEARSLRQVLERSRARERFARCGGTVRVIHASKNEVAWLLGVPLRAVSRKRAKQLGIQRGVAVVRRVSEPGTPGRRARSVVLERGEEGQRTRLLARLDKWSVYEFGCEPGLPQPAGNDITTGRERPAPLPPTSRRR
jgi:hypothetical protein